MNNCCKDLRIRSKHYKRYFYCAKAKKVIDIDCCKNCIFKEYKIYKSMTTKRKKENDISIFTEDYSFTLYVEQGANLKRIKYKAFSKKIIECEKHHIFGGKNRKNSDFYGLFLWIPKSIHNLITKHPNLNIPLEQLAQKTFEKKYPELDFKKIFYTNSL